MRPILAAVLLLVPSIAFCADEFSIDDYEFEWIVAKSGEAKLAIVKNEDSTNAVIKTSANTLTIAPDDATKVGDALAKTSAMVKQLKGSKGKTEQIKAGRFLVLFLTSEEGDFHASVSKADSPLSLVVLEKNECLTFAPHLQKAKKMAEYLDKKIGL